MFWAAIWAVICVGFGRVPKSLTVGLDQLGEYVASFTAAKPNDKKSQRRSIVSLEQALRIFEFLMGNSPFEFYNDVWSQVLGYQQGAPQSAIEVNWFVLGWDEHVHTPQLRDRKELQSLKLFIPRWSDHTCQPFCPSFHK